MRHMKYILLEIAATLLRATKTLRPPHTLPYTLLSFSMLQALYTYAICKKVPRHSYAIVIKKVHHDIEGTTAMSNFSH